MEIKRERYLSKLISFMWDGQVKVITGIRRCGKSYLLHTLFKNYLLGEGVAEDHILSFELDLTRDIRYTGNNRQVYCCHHSPDENGDGLSGGVWRNDR